MPLLTLVGSVCETQRRLYPKGLFSPFGRRVINVIIEGIVPLFEAKCDRFIKMWSCSFFSGRDLSGYVVRSTDATYV